MTTIPKPKFRGFWGEFPYFSAPFGVTTRREEVVMKFAQAYMNSLISQEISTKLNLPKWCFFSLIYHLEIQGPLLCATITLPETNKSPWKIQHFDGIYKEVHGIFMGELPVSFREGIHWNNPRQPTPPDRATPCKCHVLPEPIWSTPLVQGIQKMGWNLSYKAVLRETNG